MIPPDLKLCDQCAHFVADGERCGRTFVIDYVHGKHWQYSASTERQSASTDDCGPEARHFKAKAGQVVILGAINP